MNTNSILRLVIVTLLASAASSCGGGGGSGSVVTPPPPPPPTGGIRGTGIALGPVTGFGSVFVNGIEFSTNGAQITVEDSSGTEADLKVGQIVEVRGDIDASAGTGTATSIVFSDSLEGPITAIDLATNSLNVLGQTVRVNGATIFDDRISPASLAGLNVNDIVEVSGNADNTGVVIASRIEPKAAGNLFELKGTVSNLSGNTFSIGPTTIDFSSALLVNGSPSNGACVEVKGNAFNQGTLVATRVEVKSCTLGASANDLGEIEGLITRFVSVSDFDVGGQAVTTNASTTYEGGTSADLGVNLKVEVEGSFNASLVLVARKVQIKPDNSTRLLGVVDSLNAGASTLTMFGVTVETGSATSWNDKSAANARPFDFSDLRTGDYLEVRGFEATTAGRMIGVFIERDDIGSRREIRGKATNIAQPDLRILGVDISTSAGTIYRDVDGTTINANDFFATAGNANRFVKVRGTWNGTVFATSEAELETP
ncbi:MAG: DUF5666 domain-containing protein [Steroidobacteraceae bacterium]